MDKPEKLVLNDESYFSMGRSGALAGIGMMIFAGGIALTQTDATLADLVLPFGALSIFWLAWVAINTIVGLIHRLSTKRDIDRFFEQEIWQHWQLRSDEWQGVVEAEYQTMCPEGGASAYIGAVYSTIAGLVVSAILVGVGKYVIKDEQAMPIILICAVAVVILLAGVGLFQPIQERNKARKYRRKALRVLEPRVWFGAEGVYHEASGYTSLKELRNVNDHTKTRQTIKFTIEVTTGGGSSSPMATYHQPVSFAVPSGYEQQAARLVRRYRQERLRD
jgi:hypothetical protein